MILTDSYTSNQEENLPFYSPVKLLYKQPLLPTALKNGGYENLMLWRKSESPRGDIILRYRSVVLLPLRAIVTRVTFSKKKKKKEKEKREKNGRGKKYIQNELSRLRVFPEQRSRVTS